MPVGISWSKETSSPYFMVLIDKIIIVGKPNLPIMRLALWGRENQQDPKIAVLRLGQKLLGHCIFGPETFGPKTFWPKIFESFI